MEVYRLADVVNMLVERQLAVNDFVSDRLPPETAGEVPTLRPQTSCAHPMAYLQTLATLLTKADL